MRAKSVIRDEVKFDTKNYTEEVQGWHYWVDEQYNDEEETLYVIDLLQKHYKYVDYYTGEHGYYIYASQTYNYGENPCDVNYREGQ